MLRVICCSWHGRHERRPDITGGETLHKRHHGKRCCMRDVTGGETWRYFKRRAIMVTIGETLSEEKCLGELHLSFEYTVSMLTFFTALHQKVLNSPFLKMFVSAIIDNVATICWRYEKINNYINSLNIQCACSPSLKLYARKWQILPL